MPTTFNEHSSGTLDIGRSISHDVQIVSSMNKQQQNPINYLGVFYEGAVAGAAAGVVVEAALYPIDTIKTRLQAAHGGGKLVLRNLYSGLAGNLFGVLP
ncbi:hypothetical protein Leryth_021555 [Lithospermum erythrorhizon]|nr:hypothetical protein Leryth_021555 [Lithospermum erythrorhizon]